jgi:hypothetical protein
MELNDITFLLISTTIILIGFMLILYFDPELRKIRREDRERKNQKKLTRH